MTTFETVQSHINWAFHRVEDYLNSEHIRQLYDRAYSAGDVVVQHTVRSAHEVYERVVNLNLEVVNRSTATWVDGGKKLVNDVCNLTKVGLATEDFFPQLFRGELWPKLGSFTFNGERRSHLWDLAARVGAFSLLIVAGVTAYRTYNSASAFTTPLFRTLYFGPTPSRLAKGLCHLAGTLIYASISMTSGLLASDLISLANVIEWIDHPFETTSWYTGLSRNVDVLMNSRRVKAAFKDLAAEQLERNVAGITDEEIRTFITKSLWTEFSEGNFKDVVDDHPALVERFGDYQKALLSILLEESNIGHFGFLQHLFDQLQPHVGLLKKSHPFLTHLLGNKSQHSTTANTLSASLRTLIPDLSLAFSGPATVKRGLRKVKQTFPYVADALASAADDPTTAMGITSATARSLMGEFTGVANAMVPAATVLAKCTAPISYNAVNSLFTWYRGTKEDREIFRKTVDQVLNAAAGARLAFTLRDGVYYIMGQCAEPSSPGYEAAVILTTALAVPHVIHVGREWVRRHTDENPEGLVVKVIEGYDQGAQKVADVYQRVSEKASQAMTTCSNSRLGRRCKGLGQFAAVDLTHTALVGCVMVQILMYIMSMIV